MALKHKTAVVLGGHGGIGTEIGKHLLKNGISKLFILDIVPILDSEKRAEMQACNIDAIIFYEQCDITKKEQMSKLLRSKVVEKLNFIDVFVNSAGIVNEQNPEAVVAINLVGAINSSLIALDLMSLDNSGLGGYIINVASIAGLEPFPYCSVYTATKHGIVGFTRSLGIDTVLVKTGVKFITICPGATETSLFQKSRNVYLFPWMEEPGRKLMRQIPLQNPGIVGECVIRALVEGETGSVWICVGGRIERVTSPSMWNEKMLLNIEP
ncbi:alcohol dehydrogenase 1-like [Toxorhynchites rutilus septentrionalis]|uniref:alcohol dehydrogenase 1-like n=1 Tax=Toxorhynchites rutilus septentrionalis TaxID=329112 RepID=UPI002478442D|nr:alcohol dehydrogenase 1-like [Toxorhynchites rutilus septentrionalis]XP_055623619.1 alcohol dehydrogenase 1-like [Toxorhynchites rutilus septentrionalis]